jgi:hypothetical protein
MPVSKSGLLKKAMTTDFKTEQKSAKDFQLHF